MEQDSGDEGGEGGGREKFEGAIDDEIEEEEQLAPEELEEEEAAGEEEEEKEGTIEQEAATTSAASTSAMATTASASAPAEDAPIVPKPMSSRRTTRYLTKYERARLLGTRALQISQCAPIMVELDGETDPLEIAMKELREKKIPMIIRRYLPDGSFEDWSMDELIID